MEAAVVSVSMGVMKPLLSKLTKLLEEEYVKAKGVRKKIRFLRNELSAMSATLQILADAEQLNPEVRLWRDKLRELAYDLEDCIDDFMARVDHGHDGCKGFKEYYRKLKRIMARREIATQIEELKASVMEASERHKRYDFAQLKHNPGTSSVDPRLQALYEDIENLVGIDGPKKHIIELLTTETDGSSAKLKVVSIAGCGGLGKTTLAKQVYDTIKGQFSCSAFVSVSRTPDVRKILIHIAHGVKLTGINTQDDDEQQLIDKLREHLHDKRYIVVIDDVWEEKAWELIKLALPNNDIGSRIISTTRSVMVAECCSSQVYELKPLCFDDSKRLFLKRAFGSENSCYPHLEDVPDRILRKCGGLPLAIVTVSSMLTNELAKEKWDRILSAIGSALSNKPDAKRMASIISMSYFDIPHHLRTCLLYLSVFPEDYEIEKHCLINRWVAEGFIHEEEGRTKYETGEGYFNDLINRSMIQPVSVKYGQAEACRVHDIILDYIKCKAEEENFALSLDAAEHLCTTEYKVRRLSIINHMETNVALWANPNLSQVRSVTIFGRAVKISLLPSAALRVLDQEGDCWGMDSQFFASIEKLFHLKYLRLSWFDNISEKIGELKYLQTLDVRDTHVKELPSTIIKLLQLAHLYVRCNVRFPDGIIGGMHSLEEVSEYGVCYEQEKSLQEFSKLTKLRTLKIKWHYNPNSLDGAGRLSEAELCHSYVGTLLSSRNLYNLYITNFPLDNFFLDEGVSGLRNSKRECLQSLPLDNYGSLSLDSWNPAAPCTLRKLCIKNCFFIYNVANWMVSLGNLVVLKLDCIMYLRQDDVEVLGAIPSLLFLKLKVVGGTNGRIIVHGSNGFRSLKYLSLHIAFCGITLEFKVGSMPKLEHMKLKLPLHKEGCLNGASSLGFQHLSALNKVEIKLCGCMDDRNYDPTEDKRDWAVRRVASAINDAIAVRFEGKYDLGGCERFDCYIRKLNRDMGGCFNRVAQDMAI
ncbi:unnamed protein product [Urochloa humidicola]